MLLLEMGGKNLYSKDSKRSPGIRSYALLDAFRRVRALCVCV